MHEEICSKKGEQIVITIKMMTSTCCTEVIELGPFKHAASWGHSFMRHFVKGTVSRDFFIQVFSWIIFPQAPENNTRVISNFFKNLRRYLQVKVRHRWQICHWYQQHRRQILPPVRWCSNFPRVSLTPAANLRLVSLTPMKIIGTISDCLHLRVILKEKNNLYVNSTNQRCPDKIIKTFLIEDFFHSPSWSTTPVVHLELGIQYLHKFLTKKLKSL